MRAGFVLEVETDHDRLVHLLRDRPIDLLILDVALAADPDFHFLARMRHHYPPERLLILVTARTISLRDTWAKIAKKKS